jgi:hypothetical protein
MVDLPSMPASARAAYYRRRAVKLRKLAEAEKIESIRRQLREFADEYEKLADSLAQPVSK